MSLLVAFNDWCCFISHCLAQYPAIPSCWMIALNDRVWPPNTWLSSVLGNSRLNQAVCCLASLSVTFSCVFPVLWALILSSYPLWKAGSGRLFCLISESAHSYALLAGQDTLMSGWWCLAENRTGTSAQKYNAVMQCFQRIIRNYNHNYTILPTIMIVMIKFMHFICFIHIFKQL